MNQKRCSWSDKLVEHVEGLLSGAEEDALRNHLAKCTDCSREVNEIRSIVQLAREQEVATPSPRMEARLWDTLSETLERRRERVAGATPGATPAATPVRPLSPPWWNPRPLIEALSRAMRGRRLALAGVATAALLLVLWMGNHLMEGPVSPPAPSAEVALVLEMLREEDTAPTVSTSSDVDRSSAELSREVIPETFADDLLALEGYLAEEVGVELLLEDLTAEEEEGLNRFLQIEYGITPAADESAPAGEESSYQGPSRWLNGSTPGWEKV